MLLCDEGQRAQMTARSMHAPSRRRVCLMHRRTKCQPATHAHVISLIKHRTEPEFLFPDSRRVSLARAVASLAEPPPEPANLLSERPPGEQWLVPATVVGTGLRRSPVP